MNNKTVRILAVAALVLSLASCGVRDADEGKETEIIIKFMRMHAFTNRIPGQ